MFGSFEQVWKCDLWKKPKNILMYNAWGGHKVKFSCFFNSFISSASMFSYLYCYNSSMQSVRSSEVEQRLNPTQVFQSPNTISVCRCKHCICHLGWEPSVLYVYTILYVLYSVCSGLNIGDRKGTFNQSGNFSTHIKRDQVLMQHIPGKNIYI